MDHVSPSKRFRCAKIIFCLAGSCHRLMVMAMSGRFSRSPVVRDAGQIVAELYRTKVYVGVADA
jgi:hypothetical protein